MSVLVSRCPFCHAKPGDWHKPTCRLVRKLRTSANQTGGEQG